jgi:hypothetical protein
MMCKYHLDYLQLALEDGHVWDGPLPGSHRGLALVITFFLFVCLFV